MSYGLLSHKPIPADGPGVRPLGAGDWSSVGAARHPRVAHGVVGVARRPGVRRDHRVRAVAHAAASLVVCLVADLVRVGVRVMGLGLGLGLGVGLGLGLGLG